VCFYLSPATKIREFKKLCKLLEGAFEKYPFEPVQRNPAPFVFKETAGEWVGLFESENRVCAANCGLFPPCVPLIKRGERITKEKIELLEKANNVFGLNDGKIYVYKE
jgi:arginine/lysine/ornithine decarboxylase